MQISNKDRKFFIENGYLVIPGFFSDAEIQDAVDLHERVWVEKRSDIVVDNMDTSERMRLSEVPKDLERGPFKVNDLYLKYDEIRNLALHPRLTGLLELLVVDKPVLINSLDVDFGTQQKMHVDSLFMTPPTPFNLVAAWVALEDGSEESGPLEYYPGSHMISPYKFSTGSTHVVSDEFDDFEKYVADQIELLGLKRERFIPKKGDVLIWHSYLLHGGSERKNKAATRKSTIYHYYTESAARLSGHELTPYNDAYYYHREPCFDVQIKSSEQLNAPAENTPVVPEEGRFVHSMRTTLHYFRQWKSDIGRILFN